MDACVLVSLASITVDGRQGVRRCHHFCTRVFADCRTVTPPVVVPLERGGTGRRTAYVIHNMQNFFRLATYAQKKIRQRTCRIRKGCSVDTLARDPFNGRDATPAIYDRASKSASTISVPFKHAPHHKRSTRRVLRRTTVHDKRVHVVA